MIWLGTRRGYLTDWTTQKWVQVTGRRVTLDEAPWLAGPIGDTTTIGPQFFDDLADSERLTIRAGDDAGLLSSMDVLDSPELTAAKVDPRVVDFYEHTAAYDLDAWGEWSGLFRPFGKLLASLFSRRLQQLNVPVSALDTSRGITSRVIKMVDSADTVRYTAWIRTLVGSQDVLYAGTYSVCTVPRYSGPCVKVVFPLPNGSAMVIMRATVSDGGSLMLLSAGSGFGDTGFYFTVHDHQGRVWARYIRTFRESIHVFPDNDKVRADHVLSLWGVTFLRLHYRLARKEGQTVDIAI